MCPRRSAIGRRPSDVGSSRSLVARAVSSRPPHGARSLPAPAGPTVTFNQDIAPILFEHCATCHRPARPDGEPGRHCTEPDPTDPLCIAGAPFSLLDYASARAHARARSPGDGRPRAMPPWLPEPAMASSSNERRLSDDQIALIQAVGQRRARQKATPRRARQPPPFPEWLAARHAGPRRQERRGLHAARRRAATCSATSCSGAAVADPLRARDRVPRRQPAGAPSCQRRASIRARVSRRLDRADPGPGFAAMPEDAGAERVRLVAGQGAGHRAGRHRVDARRRQRSGRPAAHGAERRPKRSSRRSGCSSPTRRRHGCRSSSSSNRRPSTSPPARPNYVVEDSYVLPADVDVVSVYPHAHYLAQEMRGTATLPDGTVKPLLLDQAWDVRWQDQYRYRAPLPLPEGHDAAHALHLRQLRRQPRTTAATRRRACAGARSRRTRWARSGWRSFRRRAGRGAADARLLRDARCRPTWPPPSCGA